MIKSGMFDSVNGDRKYRANDFASYFATFIGNGVFPNPSDGFQVIANDDMTVSLRPGQAWVNGYYITNDSDYNLEIDVADGVLNRIDRIVLRLDYLEREITPVVKKGAFASTSPVPPTLQRDADAYEIALADIYVGQGVLSISQADITDLRLNADLCGIVHGTVDQVDTTTLFNQYESWYNQTTSQAETDIDAVKQQFNDDLAQFNVDWDAWFSEQQTEGFVMASEKGVADGVASLDSSGKVPSEQIDVDTSDLATKEEVDNLQTEVSEHKADYAQHITSTERTTWNNKLDSADLTEASLTKKGIVQLSNSTESTSDATASTSSAVKQAYDKAVQAETTANNAPLIAKGSYQGNGASSNRLIAIGFEPKLVYLTTIGSSSGADGKVAVTGYGGENIFMEDSSGSITGEVSSQKASSNGVMLSSSGLLVGGNWNESGENYGWVAIG